jgi:hypothetical protein
MRPYARFRMRRSLSSRIQPRLDWDHRSKSRLLRCLSDRWDQTCTSVTRRACCTSGPVDPCGAWYEPPASYPKSGTRARWLRRI